MQKVDSEIRASSTSSTRLARKLIEDNRDKVEAMAKALLEWETIDADQIDDIMQAGRRVRPSRRRPPASRPTRAAPAPAVRSPRADAAVPDR